MGAVSRADSTLSASIPCISQSSSTRLLRFQQSSPDDIQVGERSGHFQPVQVLRQSAVAGLAEAKDVLDHAEHVLDLGAHPRLVAILRLLDLIDSAVEAITTVREVLRFWRRPPSFQ